MFRFRPCPRGIFQVIKGLLLRFEWLKPYGIMDIHLPEPATGLESKNSGVVKIPPTGEFAGLPCFFHHPQTIKAGTAPLFRKNTP
jgi:hypothetical protein